MPDDPQPPYPLHPSILPRLSPDYAAFYNKYLANKQQVHLQPIAASRTSNTLIPGAGRLQHVAGTFDHAVPRQHSAGPPVPVRCFTPKGERPEGGWPVCVYFHGGGWVLGGIDTENVVATHLCARGRCVVVAVDYRLAPENPFPAAVQDAWEAVCWIVGGSAQSVLHINATKLAAAGSSAGANLAAVMCQRAVASGRGGAEEEAGEGEGAKAAIATTTRTPPPFLLQLLSVPVTDNTANPATYASWAANQHAPALPAEKMLWYRLHYLPNPNSWADPEASPLLWTGDWSMLPPACIVLGELDVLRSEGEMFGHKLQRAGVDAEVHIMEGQPHPFIAMDGVLEAGARAITLFCDALHMAMYGWMAGPAEPPED